MIRWLVVIGVLAGSAAADRKAAERFFRAGAKAYDAQNFAAAAQNFERAYAEEPLPEIAFSAAQAYRRQYRVDPQPRYVKRAVDLYKLYVQKVKSGGRVGDAADSLGEMAHELEKLGAAGKLTAQEAEGLTSLGVSVVFADTVAKPMHEIEDRAAGPSVTVETSIDGNHVEPDVMQPLGPGDHVVRAVATGYAPLEKTWRLVAGRQDMAELELKPLPARVTVDAEPGATISVDGRRAITMPIEVAAGHHLFVAARRGREPAGVELDVTRGQDKTVALPLAKTTRRWLVPWVAGVAGGFAVFSTLGAFGALHYDHKAAGEYNAMRTPGDQTPAALQQYNDDHARRDQLVTGVYITGAIALGIGLTAAWMYYFDTPSTEGVRIAPIAAPGGGGAAVAGRF